jgi:hypothetical protein
VVQSAACSSKQLDADSSNSNAYPLGEMAEHASYVAYRRAFAEVALVSLTFTGNFEGALVHKILQMADAHIPIRVQAGANAVRPRGEQDEDHVSVVAPPSWAQTTRISVRSIAHDQGWGALCVRLTAAKKVRMLHTQPVGPKCLLCCTLGAHTSTIADFSLCR